MKKVLLSLLMAASFGLVASAQDNPIKIGVKAGVTFPTISGGDVDGDTKANTSFYVGGTVDFAVSEMFSIQPGLILSGKGAKSSGNESFGGESISAKAKLSLMYIEIPVNAIVNFPVGEGKVFLGAGPYYGYAVSGKLKYSATTIMDGDTETVSSDQDVKFGKDADMKRSDFGVNFLGGYQLSNGFNIHAGYGLGLSNTSADGSGLENKNRVFSVGVGFSF